jgi:O-methyltransferase involved in polyketide biosynthesis
MARTDNDTWDLATSVGATATGVVVGRALASRGADPPIDDPFADPLVRAVGVDFFKNMPSVNPAQTAMQTQVQTLTDRWRQHGLDLDISDLWYFGDRNDVGDYLSTHGWDTVATGVAALFAAQRLSAQPANAEEAQIFTSFTYLTATRH